MIMCPTHCCQKLVLVHSWFDPCLGRFDTWHLRWQQRCPAFGSLKYLFLHWSIVYRIFCYSLGLLVTSSSYNHYGESDQWERQNTESRWAMDLFWVPNPTWENKSFRILLLLHRLWWRDFWWNMSWFFTLDCPCQLVLLAQHHLDPVVSALIVAWYFFYLLLFLCYPTCLATEL
jgi:hypothetical protein